MEGGKPRLLALGLLLGGLAAPLAWVAAAELVVPTDYALVADAVAVAADGDTVLVLPGEHPVEWPISWSNRDLVLRSLSGSATTALYSVWMYRGLMLGGGVGFASVVEGFTLRDFWDSAIICTNASPTLRDLVIVEGGGTSDTNLPGGGLHCEASSPQVMNVTFRGNRSRAGGAIYCNGSSPLFYNVRCEGNHAVGGGAVYIDGGAPQFIGCQFVDNEAFTFINLDDVMYMDGCGGAVYAEGDASPSFAGCVFVGNQATIIEGPHTEALGGAGYFTESATPHFQNCSFVANGAESRGGTILVRDGASPTFTASIIAFSSTGGGLLAEDAAGTVDLSCCDVYGNVGGDYFGLPDQTGQNGNVSANPRFCDLAAGELTLAQDSPCLPANNGCSLQIGALGEGCLNATGVEDTGDSPPPALRLGCFPNPFNPTTALVFSLPEEATVDLAVFDLSGRRVAVLLDGRSLHAGRHQVDWAGVDADGRRLPSGIYLLRLSAGAQCSQSRVVLLK